MDSVIIIIGIIIVIGIILYMLKKKNETVDNTTKTEIKAAAMRSRSVTGTDELQQYLKTLQMNYDKQNLFT